MQDDPFDSITDDLGEAPAKPATVSGQGTAGGGNRSFAQELLSQKVNGRQRIFFIDLKESSNGKFIKMSELSRGGQRSTIMFDIEDLPGIMEAFDKIQKAA